MDDLVERLPKEAAMLREIAQSYSRGVEWRANLSASATVIEQAAASIEALETSLAEARRQAFEEAAKACEAERLCEPQDDSDAAYDNAIDHCAQAIRALASGDSPSPPPVV